MVPSPVRRLTGRLSSARAIGWTALVLTAAFTAVNAVNALSKGGDATDFFAGGAAILHGLPLYAASKPASGFIGPPFQALFFAPFAALAERSDAAARLAWYAANLVFLAAGVVCWRRASLEATRGEPVEADRDARDLALAALAVLLPLQRNFEQQNMNALLLGILGLAAWCLVSKRPSVSGALLGFATALKVFPGAAIAYLALRRQWKACGVALATTGALSALPMVVTGPAAFGADTAAWLRIGAGGWPTRGNNQSLVAAFDRLAGSWYFTGIHTVAAAPLAAALSLVTLAALAGVAVILLARERASLRAAPVELAAVLVLGILASPIAWNHYWLLLFPAFYLLRRAARPALLGRGATAAFWTAAILVTGLTRGTVGMTAWSLTRKASSNTIAAIVVYVALVALARAIARQPAVRSSAA